jgi:hypothetical protein
VLTDSLVSIVFQYRLTDVLVPYVTGYCINAILGDPLIAGEF